MKKKVDIWTAY